MQNNSSRTIIVINQPPGGDTALTTKLQVALAAITSELEKQLVAKAWYRAIESVSPQPTSDVLALVEALEHITNMDSMSYHSLESAKIVARKALAAYRKQGGMATTIFYCPGCGETDENKRCLGCRHR